MTDAIICNKLQELIRSGLYHDALSAFMELKNPSSAAKRLAGRAYWGLGNFLEAEVLLTEAVVAGDLGAQVDRLHIQTLQNKIDDAEFLFNQVKSFNLTAKDKIQLQLLGGEIAIRQNKLSLAKTRLHAAWIDAKSNENCGTLLQSIGLSLSTAYHLSGDDGNALKTITHSLKGANEFWSAILRVNQIKFTQYFQSQNNIVNDLAALPKDIQENPQLKVVIEQLKGLNHYASNPIIAIQILENSIVAAKSIENHSLQFQNRCFLIGMYIAQNDFDKARGHLAKLETQASTPNEIAMLEMRRGQFWTAVGNLDLGAQSLHAAQQLFRDLEWRRELGWTLLHLAQNSLLQKQNTQASEYLDLLGDVANIIENTEFLALERRFIGNLEPLKAIASSYGLETLTTNEPLRAPIPNRPTPRGLRLSVFGEPVLYVNGRATPIKLNKGFEIMAYLLLFPHSSAEKIVTDLFENSKDLDAAKSYFHTARYQIMAACPYIKFPYNKITHTYALDTSEFDIEFDYHDVAQLLHAPSENEFYQALELCRGPFLHGFEGQWIEEVRANMEWLLVRSGLKLVQEMYESGDYQACRRLTERLLKIEPYDETLNEVLVRATREIDGALASRKAMSKVESNFLSEVGELPPTLEQLKSELKYRMN